LNEGTTEVGRALQRHLELEYQIRFTAAEEQLLRAAITCPCADQRGSRSATAYSARAD
jgi:hypothetical protein